MGQLEDIKKLSPREKLTKLKELEKKNKEEIELARKMMDESEREVAIEEELKKIPIPEVKAVNIDELFSAEAKDIFKTKRFLQDKKPEAEEEAKAQEKGLEETVRAEAKNVTRNNPNVQYGLALEEAKSLAKTLVESYDTIKDLTERAREGEYMTKIEQERLDSYRDAAKSLYEEKFSLAGSQEKEAMIAAEKMLLYERNLKR